MTVLKMSIDNELRDLMDQTAEELKRLNNNPSTWEVWIVYLLRQLEQQSMDEDPLSHINFQDMLPSLQEDIRRRLRTGGW